MTSVRQRKKESIRKQILESAKESFLTDGFEETTIADIAARANIGVGTLYNYFPSKALLYMESYYREIGNPKERLDEIIRNYGSNPVLTLTKIIEVYLEPYRKFDKNVMRELFIVFMDSVDKHEELGEVYSANKYIFINFLAKIIHTYQEKGILDHNFDRDEGAFAIFSIITTNALFYIMDQNITYEEMQDRILRQTDLFFQGKVKKKGGRK